MESRPQFDGFKEALQDLNVEYQVYEMDTKRLEPDHWPNKGEEAKALIESWQPDMVYANDDNAQEFVVSSYVNTETPFVFSAVNAAPEQYGYPGSSNVTGGLRAGAFHSDCATFETNLA